ncbi:GNAT family N-acetyltransferase [Ornithinimicrobium cerasi]|uniref:Acetyltransferase (GNAT) family protein n=1 Tax=Ornithinimicrobium cerasi TaxID=2248773 RepID=A0A285VG63_9MICO|nr:GNAT family N-acetyltransferase [Ornithinimicrobium cerasi]SOC52106.1 Acetyltransferase (GNAT) family protein [Ornithinimicrobium cerasi]
MSALPVTGGAGVIVRPVRPGEHGAVGRLLVEAYAPSGMPPDLDYWDALRDTTARTRDAEVWVAELDGSLAGTVTWAGRGSGQRELSRDDEAEFRMLAVDPRLHGRGVGAALLEAVLARARTEGWSAVVLCSATWMTAAHRLYGRAGFHRIPDRDWPPVPGVQLLAFRLPLPGHHLSGSPG